MYCEKRDKKQWYAPNTGVTSFILYEKIIRST